MTFFSSVDDLCKQFESNFVVPDQVPNCLQKLSADDTIRLKVKI